MLRISVKNKNKSGISCVIYMGLLFKGRNGDEMTEGLRDEEKEDKRIRSIQQLDKSTDRQKGGLRIEP